jgi:hypothetical protein
VEQQWLIAEDKKLIEREPGRRSDLRHERRKAVNARSNSSILVSMTRGLPGEAVTPQAIRRRCTTG